MGLTSSESYTRTRRLLDFLTLAFARSNWLRHLLLIPIKYSLPSVLLSIFHLSSLLSSPSQLPLLSTHPRQRTPMATSETSEPTPVPVPTVTGTLASLHVARPQSLPGSTNIHHPTPGLLQDHPHCHRQQDQGQQPICLLSASAAARNSW